MSIVCREAVSYEHCRRHARRAEVLAADDLAFLAPSAAMRPPPFGPDKRYYDEQRQTYNDARAKFHAFLADEGWRTVLDVFRADGERNPKNPHPSGCDLSQILKPAKHRLFDQLIAAHFFLLGIDTFEEVRTDRLHVAIAGALLHKSVSLYANAYFENRAVYEFSLKTFPNVRFIEDC